MASGKRAAIHGWSALALVSVTPFAFPVLRHAGWCAWTALIAVGAAFLLITAAATTAAVITWLAVVVGLRPKE